MRNNQRTVKGVLSRSTLSPYAVLLTLLVAFWPVIRWYVYRLHDGGDEPLGIIALVSAVFIILFCRDRNVEETQQVPPLGICFLLIYGVSFWYVPPLIRAAIALLTLSYLMQRCVVGGRVELSIGALFLLSLPIISSLQFYCGYPLRAFSALLSAEVITWTGFSTKADGTLLHWAGEVISIDAPCSGVKMLWSGLFANFLIAAYLKADNWITWLSYWCTSFVVFSVNLMRITILFYTESGIIQMPQWFHEGIGVFAFAIALVCIMSFHHLSQRGIR